MHFSLLARPLLLYLKKHDKPVYFNISLYEPLGIYSGKRSTVYILKIFLINSLLAVPSLRSCMWAFSSCGSGLLIVVASLAAENGL